jgi:hypothetical protein
MQFWKLAILALLLLIAPGALAVTIYVDNQLVSDCVGDYSVADRNCSGIDGDAFSAVQPAANVVQAGDLIYVRGGTYYPTQTTIFSNDGSPTAYIELQSFPGELPVIDGNNVPEGNIELGSIPTWQFFTAQYWKVKGPIHLTNGRGAGLTVDTSQNIELELVESSYNGKRASRGAHGFLVWDGDNVLFKNCDAHHNANHLWKSIESQAGNQYQHGDGWRIFSGSNIEIIGCRSWHNLDDAYDFVYATAPIRMVDSWAAYTGIDDANGSITGTPFFDTGWGIGFKLGYDADPYPHIVIGGVSWKNNLNGVLMGQGPRIVHNSVSYANTVLGFRYYKYWQNLFQLHHYVTNNWAFANLQGPGHEPYEPDSNHNSWDLSSTFSVSAADFISLDDSGTLGPRQSDGSLPETDFLRLAPGSDLIDAGTFMSGFHCPTAGAHPGLDCREWYGLAPDIGAFESGASNCVTTNVLLSDISEWKQGSLSMIDLMQRISSWKAGTGCP